MPESPSVPLEVGRRYRVEIVDRGEEGEGVGYIDRYVVFVPEAQVGETVEVVIEDVSGRFSLGSVVERIE